MSELNPLVILTLIVIIGLMLLYLSINIDKYVKKDCQSVNIQRCNKIILSIGLIFITTGIAYMFYRYKCNCISPYDFSLNTYLIFFLVLGLILTGVGGAMYYDKDVKNCNDIKGFASITIGLGVFMVILPLFFFVTYKNLDKSRNGKGAELAKKLLKLQAEEAVEAVNNNFRKSNSTDYCSKHPDICKQQIDKIEKAKKARERAEEEHDARIAENALKIQGGRLRGDDSNAADAAAEIAREAQRRANILRQQQIQQQRS
jgi:hypothetical protein